VIAERLGELDEIEHRLGLLLIEVLDRGPDRDGLEHLLDQRVEDKASIGSQQLNRFAGFELSVLGERKPQQSRCELLDLGAVLRRHLGRQCGTNDRERCRGG